MTGRGRMRAARRARRRASLRARAARAWLEFCWKGSVRFLLTSRRPEWLLTQVNRRFGTQRKK
jgi:hypothetical protein